MQKHYEADAFKRIAAGILAKHTPCKERTRIAVTVTANTGMHNSTSDTNTSEGGVHGERQETKETKVSIPATLDT